MPPPAPAAARRTTARLPARVPWRAHAPTRHPVERGCMPHLQFQLNFPATAEEKTRFAAAAVRHFSEIMDTGTDHIGVTLLCLAREDLTFGRAGAGRAAFV